MDSGLWPSIQGDHRCHARHAIEIPLPPLPGIERQRRGVIPALASGQGAEAAQMESVRSLLHFEAKIQRVLDRVWGNECRILIN
jgi:hypothetical protein